MATWTNTSGINLWSNPNNWLFTDLPTAGDTVNFQSGTYTSVIDAGYTQTGQPTPTLGTLQLASGVTLDDQISITVGNILFGSTGNPQTGTATFDGLLEIGHGATLTYTGDTSDSSLYIKSDGVGTATMVFTGGAGPSSTITMDGVNFVSSQGIVDNVGSAVLTLKNGATWIAASTAVFNEGTLALGGSGLANLAALNAPGTPAFPGDIPGSLHDLGGPTDQEVTMSGKNNELVLPDTSDGLGLTIAGLGLTDKIELAGIATVKSATYDASQHLNFFSGTNGGGSLLATLTGVTLAGGLSATLNPSNFTVGTDATGTFVELVSCFTPGTRILTSNGELMVEDLREGDLVMTERNGVTEPRPIVWIGHRVIDLVRHPYPRMAAPIRIRRGAIADNVPHRDLVLSPDHSVLIDGCLVPAKLLVNGATITRELCAAVEYFHVECESHSIILAEGLPVETYLDTGNRAMFDNAGLALLLHPPFEVNSSAKQWADACAPLRVEADFVEPIWRRLKERSARLGWNVAGDAPATTDEADIRVSVKGRELRPVGFGNGRHIFVLPHDVAEVTLLSRTFCPATERPWIDDQRQLGVAVREVVFRGNGDCGNGDFLTLPADVPHLTRGWWPAEDDGKAHWRWTDGAGIIAMPFPTRVMEVGVAMTALYPVDQTWGRRLAA